MQLEATGVELRSWRSSGRRECCFESAAGTVHFQCADVFNLLPELEKQGEKYDVVILDPPAFTKQEILLSMR